MQPGGLGASPLPARQFGQTGIYPGFRGSGSLEDPGVPGIRHSPIPGVRESRTLEDPGNPRIPGFRGRINRNPETPENRGSPAAAAYSGTPSVPDAGPRQKVCA